MCLDATVSACQKLALLGLVFSVKLLVGGCKGVDLNVPLLQTARTKLLNH